MSWRSATQRCQQPGAAIVREVNRYPVVLISEQAQQAHPVSH